MKNLPKISTNQSGFMLPTVLTFLVIISSLGLTLLQTTLQSQSSAIRYSYIQMAHIASKAAIDFAEEAYEINPNYNGTAEQDLVVTVNYRLTIQVNVLYNQGTNAKRIQAFGRVYIPETDNNADYVRDIQASVIRNGEVIGDIDPSDYDPLLWLDANTPAEEIATPLIQPASIPQTQYISSIYGSGVTSGRDIAEQRAADATGNPGQPDYGNDDIEFAYDGNARGNQSTGIRFRGLNVDNSDNVNSAYIQFTVDETKNSSAVTILVQGVDLDNAPQWIGNYAVDNAVKTTASVTWIPPTWPDVGGNGINHRVDVTEIVQEIVDRPGWAAGNNIAFTFIHVSGSGVRTAEKGNNGASPELFVEWGASGGSGAATANGDEIQTWLDRSINNNDAELTYGSNPVLTTGAINGLNAVTFADGAMLSELASLTQGNTVTAFVVMRPKPASDYDARFLTLMRSTQSNDYNTKDGMVLLQKRQNTTNLSQYYNNQTGLISYSNIDNTWALYTTRISTPYVERLNKNGYENCGTGAGCSNVIDTSNSSNDNVDYNLDQIYVGGRRTGTGAGSGTQYADMDVAEIIVYDELLACSEMLDLETQYFGPRYGLTISPKSC